MPDHLYVRSQIEGPAVALSRRLFRKQILRYGKWSHPAAPGGVLNVTKEFVTKIADNFKRGVRDNVPIPLGHEMDAISSVGKVVGLEVDENGLWGIHEIEDAEAADKIGKVWTGTSAFIDLNAEDKETGEKLGPVLVHNAITNAPYIKGLAPFESVALGEDAQDAVVIALHEQTDEPGGAMTLEELLHELQETSDDELRAALQEHRPEVLASATEAADDDEEALEAARREGREAVVAALAEKGITVALSESAAGSDEDVDVDIESHPVVVALAERVTKLEGEKVEAAAEAVIDKAIAEGKVLPSQREGLLEVALSENGMDRLTKIIPSEAVVDLSEKGTAPGDETNVSLSEEDAQAEADRLVAAYASKTKTKE